MNRLKNSPFTSISQVVAVVKDAEKTAQALTSLGLGPFKQLPQSKTPIQYQRQNTEAKAIELATRFENGTELSLIEPLEGRAIWHESLRRSGEGTQYLGFFVEDIDKEEENLVSQGIGLIQKERNGTGGSSYFGTDAVGGVIFRLVQRPKDIEIPRVAPEGNPFARLFQMGLIIPDLDAVTDYYASLGIGPVTELKMQVPEKFIRGESFKSEKPFNKISITQVGEVQLELIQPVIKPSLWQDFVDQTGGGLQHIAFHLGEEIHKEIEKLVKKGAGKFIYGWGPIDAFYYFEPISGIIIEFFRKESEI